MTEPIFRTNCASHEQLVAHLRSCDQGFLPPLSSRVELFGYASKLQIAARRFEAWDSAQVVGLVAAYFDGPVERTAFITSVSVLPTYKGRGIAAQLIEKCLQQVRIQEFNTVKLEVNSQSQAAVGLYKKYGFACTSINGDTLTMILKIEGVGQ